MTGKMMRPPVSIHTLARSANAVVNERKTARARYGRSSGSVTETKRCHALRVSRLAYSKSSVGIALRPARRNTAVNDAPRQTLNRATLMNVYVPPPNAPSTSHFMDPATAAYEVVIGGFIIQYHAITETPPGYAQGRKTAGKTSARPSNGTASSSAIPIPRTSFAKVVTPK